MLSAALDQLGLDLGITLPGDFRRELADPAVHEAFRSAMLDANPKLAGDDAVGDTVARLRQGNRGFRASARWRGWEDQTQGMPEGSDGEKAWPRHWFWVGGNFSGDAYFLDLSRDPAPVAFWSHESLSCRVEKPSFVAWAARIP